MIALSTSATEDFHDSILYWPDIAGIPFIGADTRNKKPNALKWKWSDVDYTKINFREKAKTGVYDNGIALVLGRTLAGNLYSFALDFDGEDAVLAWFGSWDRVLDAAKKTRIEWHQDKWRLHYMFLAKRPISNKR